MLFLMQTAQLYNHDYMDPIAILSSSFILKKCILCMFVNLMKQLKMVTLGFGENVNF